MPTFTSSLRVPVPAAQLFDWHERPGALVRLTPPWQPVEVERWDGIRDGDRAVMRLGVGPLSIRWVAEHRAYSDACRDGDGDCQFQDVQLSGPFASWSHLHRMTPDGEGASVLHDEVTYTLPLAPVSSVVAGWAAEGQIERLFAYRHRITHEDLVRHTAMGNERLTVAITGSTGLVGSQLAAFLTGGGHRIVRLVRSHDDVAKWTRGDQEGAVYWNVANGDIDLEALEREAPDAVVHLAGESIVGLRFSEAKKRAIWESRTKGTQLLSRALAALDRPPRVLVSASASGYYGDTGDEAVTEGSPPGSGFLADLCRAWEASTAEAEAAGIRVVHARIGLVTTPTGGLLQVLAAPTRLGLGGWPGDGGHYLPWISLDDAVYALTFLLQDEALRGPVNLSAPEPVTTKVFVKTLADTLDRPAVFSIPAPVIRALGGEVARELALKSTRMLPVRLLDAGFRFSTPDLDRALGHVLGRLDADTLSTP